METILVEAHKTEATTGGAEGGVEAGAAVEGGVPVEVPVGGPDTEHRKGCNTHDIHIF